MSNIPKDSNISYQIATLLELRPNTPFLPPRGFARGWTLFGWIEGNILCLLRPWVNTPVSGNNEEKSKGTSVIDPKSNLGIIERVEKLGGLALHGLRRRVTNMDPYILSLQSKEDFFDTFKESGIDHLITRMVWHDLQPPQAPPSS